MALTRNREIEYKNFVEWIEHRTGKTVKSWKRESHRLSTLVIFTDNTCTYLDEGMLYETIQFEEIPKSICASCGEEMHVSSWNWKKQCTNTAKLFWEKVRKLYWHRYLKAK
jgi:NADH pyrophosphatase NudC (nudix superfamily)